MVPSSVMYNRFTFGFLVLKLLSAPSPNAYSYVPGLTNVGNKGVRNEHFRTAKFTVLPELRDELMSCINTSVSKYENSSGPGPWIDMNLLSNSIYCLNSTELSPDSNLIDILFDKMNISVVDLICEQEFYVSLFYCPPFQEIPSRRHGPGAVIILKSLFGFGDLISTINSRPIQRDSIESRAANSFKAYGLENLLASDIVVRTGGPERTFKNSNSIPAVFLEIVVNAPLTNAFGECNYLKSHAVNGTFEFVNESVIIESITASSEDLATVLRKRRPFVSSRINVPQPAIIHDVEKMQKRDMNKFDVVPQLNQRIGGLDKVTRASFVFPPIRLGVNVKKFQYIAL